MNRNYLLILVTLFIFSTSCTDMKKSFVTSNINEDEMKEWISTIASDDFQGRFPGTEGEEKTANYLAEQFKKVGANPGNGNIYFQEVPLIKITNDLKIKLKVKGAKGGISFNYLKDIIGGTPQPVEKINLSDLDLVFVAGFCGCAKFKL